MQSLREVAEFFAFGPVRIAKSKPLLIDAHRGSQKISGQFNARVSDRKSHNLIRNERTTKQMASFKTSFVAATGATFASFAPAQSNDDENQANLDVVSLVKIPRQ